MKWIAIWVEGVNVFNERKTMDPAIRKRISESVKRYWTPARRAKAATFARKRAKERKQRIRLWEMRSRATNEASEAGWPFVWIMEHWEEVRDQFWASHNDSGDWETVPGRVGLVRTKLYGVPIEPDSVPRYIPMTDDELHTLDLINLYTDIRFWVRHWP